MPLCQHLIEQSACADCRSRAAGSSRAAAFMTGALDGPAAAFGPWITAYYDGDCAGCGGDIAPGDTIRADGTGGWLCRECGEADQLAPYWEGG